jgi:hypothetical protein
MSENITGFWTKSDILLHLSDLMFVKFPRLNSEGGKIGSVHFLSFL